jgi:hypothetical protein
MIMTLVHSQTFFVHAYTSYGSQFYGMLRASRWTWDTKNEHLNQQGEDIVNILDMTASDRRSDTCPCSRSTSGLGRDMAGISG